MTRLAKAWLAASVGICTALGATASGGAADLVRVGEGPFITGGAFFVAREKGYFKKNGVDVTGILTAAGGGTAVRNTLAGGIPFGEVSLAAAVLAINSGQKLIIIGAGAQSVADQMWVVKKDSALTGIKDLIGKQIAYTSPGSVSNMLILMALKANGMTQQQVKLVPAGDLGANGCIHVIRKAASQSRSGFDQNGMSGGDERFRACRNEGDSVFVGFDFLRDADLHWTMGDEVKVGLTYKCRISEDSRHCDRHRAPKKPPQGGDGPERN